MRINHASPDFLFKTCRSQQPVVDVLALYSVFVQVSIGHQSEKCTSLFIIYFGKVHVYLLVTDLYINYISGNATSVSNQLVNLESVTHGVQGFTFNGLCTFSYLKYSYRIGKLSSECCCGNNILLFPL